MTGSPPFNKTGESKLTSTSSASDLPSEFQSDVPSDLQSDFHSLLEFAPDAIVVIDSSGQIVLINHQTELLFGYEKSELLGKPIETLVPDKFKSAHAHHRDRYLASPTTRPMGIGRRLTGRHKDGHEVPVEISLSPVKTRHGLLVTSIIRDISERQQLIEEKERVAKDLSITRQTEEILRNAIAVRDEFLSIASHELKTPISVLGLHLQLLRRGLNISGGQLTSENWQRSLDVALKQVNSLSRLIEDLLDVSRIQNGKLTLHLSRVDLSKFLHDIVDRFSSQLRLAQVSLELELRANVVAQWDQRRIEQVIMNLLSNVVKYAPGCALKITSRKLGDNVQICVQDSGPGISEDKQVRLFERFERTSSDPTVTGLGLGLFVVKRIVTAHQGSIHLESTLGKGTKFTILLPVKPQQEHPLWVESRPANLYPKKQDALRSINGL